MSAVIAVLAASLLGSPHCAAMCGGFVCVYAGTPGGAAGRWRGAAHVAYNLGRLASYVLLGGMAGAIGAGVDRAGAMAGVTRAAAVGAGVLMVLWGGAVLAASSGARVPRAPVPAAVARRLGAALGALRAQPPVVRAGAMGLLTTLLPCGWLYTFVVTAGGTGSPIPGALVMVVFWLGTLPVMVGVGLGAQRLLAPVRRRLPAVSAAVIIALGALSIAGRLHQPVLPAAHHAVPSHDAR